MHGIGLERRFVERPAQPGDQIAPADPHVRTFARVEIDDEIGRPAGGRVHCGELVGRLQGVAAALAALPDDAKLIIIDQRPRGSQRGGIGRPL